MAGWRWSTRARLVAAWSSLLPLIVVVVVVLSNRLVQRRTAAGRRTRLTMETWGRHL